MAVTMNKRFVAIAGNIGVGKSTLTGLLSQRLGFGINGVWMAYPITFIAMLILQSTYYRLVWRKQKIARLV